MKKTSAKRDPKAALLLAATLAAGSTVAAACGGTDAGGTAGSSATATGAGGAANTGNSTSTASSSGSGGHTTTHPGGGAGGSGSCTPASCDDGFNCTIDACSQDTCSHTIGPNEGPTACPVGEYCTLDKGCIKAPPCAALKDCEDAWKGDPCKANVACDAATSLCTFTPLDKDGDGHPPQVCGGDDCDDSDPKRYPGATEFCDAIDNDCNGQVDDVPPDTLKTNWNCGACGVKCEAASDCSTGTCLCPKEFQCGNDCINTQNDDENCGACGHSCGLGGLCADSACTCTWTTLCDGTCVDTQTDASNCGGCGKACGPDGACLGGVCWLKEGAACTTTPGSLSCGDKDACDDQDPWSCYLYFCKVTACGTSGICTRVYSDPQNYYTLGNAPADPTPVCGCDGVTYWDEEASDSALQSVKHAGPCSPGVPCSLNDPTCPWGSECNLPVGNAAACPAGDLSGSCWSLGHYAHPWQPPQKITLCDEAPGTCSKDLSHAIGGAPYYIDPKCP